ncbi:MAG: cbb3-type cytochrome c oxidase subunit 3 [Ignavibacteriales bacterium]|nr:cbb3-type cytochrome c oxidase subunit 3 [Ignavibacteriales bacterium]
MFENYLSSIEGVGIYPIISLLIFFIFFVALAIWAMRVDKNYLKKMRELPLEASKPQNNNFNGGYNDKL